ncbi:hypothetical protein [Butyrivibrio sp. AC2005]|uniref:hypothetical protein n=1 Tax=Butyrivibrio sp. AC2005 TaxID=1280672 RepID=UPI0004798BD7|nr:hypothetical protein [Butyrivibrio sp. AC2005]
MTLKFILNMFGSNKEKNHLFTVRSGEIVHYDKMTADKIKASKDFYAVSEDAVFDMHVSAEGGQMITEIELEEALPEGQGCLSPFIRI